MLSADQLVTCLKGIKIDTNIMIIISNIDIHHTMNPGEYQDAHEFFVHLMDKLEGLSNR